MRRLLIRERERERERENNSKKDQPFSRTMNIFQMVWWPPTPNTSGINYRLAHGLQPMENECLRCSRIEQVMLPLLTCLKPEPCSLAGPTRGGSTGGGD
jgi:hypothetical protein